jgi:hypothetical protein
VTLGERDRSGMEIEASGSGDKCVSIVVIIGRCARTESEPRHSQKRGAKGGKFVGRSMSPRRHMRECGCDGRSCVHQLNESVGSKKTRAAREGDGGWEACDGRGEQREGRQMGEVERGIRAGRERKEGKGRTGLCHHGKRCRSLTLYLTRSRSLK